ncbi:MAG TPA: inorganic diphosphatase [Gemmatimonadota bacterium]|nr:inorganic diphosphatase [Gemmatimonadota bacterium]
MNLHEIPSGPDAPSTVHVVVEIPRGSRNKVEYDPALGAFRMDRVLYASVHYPGDYGFIPSTLAPDGDPLDVLVLVNEPTFPGCVLPARPLGVLAMRDEKGQDEKVLAVPLRDPRFEETGELEDLPSHLLDEVRYFFDIYKTLEGKETATTGWEGAGRARAIIERDMATYRRERDRP